MERIFLDFETFYSQDYSLRKMTPVEYVLDPRFETIGCAVKRGVNGKSFWLDGSALQGFFDILKKHNQKICLITHNALFDMCIVAWRYGYVPDMMLDTLGIARAMIGGELKSLSLDKVAQHLGLGIKGNTVHKVVGMNAAAIRAAGLYDSYTEYAVNDVELCAGIYNELVVQRGFPVTEQVIMDTVLRCAIQPQFMLDQTKLAEHLHAIQTSKNEMLAQAMIFGLEGKSDLMSNEKFAEALRNFGVDPPMKLSQLTGKSTYAFARTDPAFIELEDHPDVRVQSLVAARMGHKSTLEETRTQRLLTISHLQWPDGRQRMMPMPLRYSGAHTHRLSGDWSLNMQNLPRGGTLRKALIAPPGHVVLACDASQIEARMVAWLCGQKDLVEQFARGEDVYSSFASRIFGRTISKADKAERFLGKTCILGMGYGVGWEKFQRTVKLQSKSQAGKQIDLPDVEAQKIVNLYRTTYHMIQGSWRVLTNQIQVLSLGGKFQIGPCEFEQGRIALPSGLHLHYPKLQNLGTDGWTYEYSGKPKRIYGGALLENLVQALARIVVMDAALRLRKRLAMFNVQLALQVHDELVYVVPEDVANVCKQIVLEEMTTRPAWAPDLPLAAEAEVGPSYGDAK